MIIKSDVKASPDAFKSFQISPLRDNKKYTMLVDKDQVKRSIFSFGDAYHNVHSKDEAENNNRKVSQEPKQFIY